MGIPGVRCMYLEVHTSNQRQAIMSTSTSGNKKMQHLITNHIIVIDQYTVLVLY